jgi:HPt (histidine-containing phosphotransfer) domain-containing protein
MMGTLERCLEAGMDDYLTKPLDISRLQDVLDRFMSSRTGLATPAAAPVAASEAHATTDTELRARIAEIAGDDDEFALELMRTFLHAATDTLREMHAAAVANDHTALGQAAHKLKGASANLHIRALTDLAQALEARLKSGRHGGEQLAVEQIAAEFDRVAATMRNEIEARAPKRVA